MAKQIPPPLDDRGRPIPDIEPSNVAPGLVNARRRIFYNPLIYVIACSVLMQLPRLYNAATKSGQASSILPMSSIGLILFAPMLSVWMGNKAGRNHWLAVRSAHLASYRRCGTCGYTFEGAAPERDGCAVCPECGTAWHQDRWSRTSTDLHGDKMLARMLCENIPAAQVAATDDFNAPLSARNYTWVPGWVQSESVPAAERDALQHQLHTIAQRSFRLVLGLAFIVWLVLGFLLFKAIDPRPANAVASVIIVGLIAGVVALAIIAVGARVCISAQRVTEVCLNVGRCPNCGCDLRYVPAGTSGRVRCPACPHAWNENRIGNRSLTPRSSP